MCVSPDYSLGDKVALPPPLGPSPSQAVLTGSPLGRGRHCPHSLLCPPLLWPGLFFQRQSCSLWAPPPPPLLPCPCFPRGLLLCNGFPVPNSSGSLHLPLVLRQPPSRTPPLGTLLRAVGAGFLFSSSCLSPATCCDGFLNWISSSSEKQEDEAFLPIL